MEKGKRILTNRLVLRNSFSVAILPPETEVEVTQIDDRNNKALVENVWVNIVMLGEISKEV